MIWPLRCDQEWWQRDLEFANIGLMKDMNNLPPGHKAVATDDGTWTLFSEAYQEACHSTSGAREETLLHYVRGCRILERAKNFSPFVILEVGFGLGIGLHTTLECWNAEEKLTFISLEIDRNLLEWFKEENKDHPILKNLYWENNLLRAKTDFLDLIIIQGDARKALPEFLANNEIQFHAVYQDAFSPKRNPTLWTKEWFKLIKDHSHPDVVLSTYSASNSIRKSLHETGWGVHKGEKFGPKRTSTRANLNSPTDAEILLQLERSPVPALTDLQIS